MRHRLLITLIGLTLVACVDHGPVGLQRIADRASKERHGDGFAVAVIENDATRTVGVA